MEIFDNVTRIVRDDLTETIKPHSRISIAAACFSIYAYQELKKQLSSIDQCRFIFTSPTFVTEKTAKEKREFYIPRLNRERSLYGTEFEVKLRNELTQKAIARECAEWIRKKATFKSNSTQEGMFVCYDREIAWTVYNKIKALRPEWFVKRKCAPEYEGTAIDRDSIEIEKVMLVCTNGKNDPAEMTAVIGDSKTRKAYVYIKTIFELNKRYGWSKFIVVVPSIAIREGVYKTFQITEDHFMEYYGKKARFFIYNSKNLPELDNFSSSSGINVMIINIQAFNARGADSRRIREELDDFGSRKAFRMPHLTFSEIDLLSSWAKQLINVRTNSPFDSKVKISSF